MISECDGQEVVWCKQCGRVKVLPEHNPCASCSNGICLGVEQPKFKEEYPNKMRIEYLKKEKAKSDRELQKVQ